MYAPAPFPAAPAITPRAPLRTHAMCVPLPPAVDPSKVPPPQPPKPFLVQLADVARRNWKLCALVGFLGLLALLLRCCLPNPRVEEESRDEDDTSSRTFGNRPLSEQQSLREQAGTSARTYGNVPLSKQKAQ